MTQVVVGIYEFGMGQAQLVLRDGIGGEFYTVPDLGAIPRIKIGADQDSWQEVVSTLLHEIIELQMALTGCRLSAVPDYGRDHAGYIFIMTHLQFSEVCGRASIFVAAALPDLAAAWKKWKKSHG